MYKIYSDYMTARFSEGTQANENMLATRLVRKLTGIRQF